MAVQCLLEAAGYRVAFAFQNGSPAGEYVDTAVELSLAAGLGDITLRSQPTFLALRDLHRFAAYFEDHIANLRKDSSREAALFVPQELGFQVQALAGDVIADDEGEFTLRFMLNVGHDDDGGRVYAGAESVISVGRTKEFVAALEGIASGILQSN
jgi:hypothetical protein